jgi:hypothetical protein
MCVQFPIRQLNRVKLLIVIYALIVGVLGTVTSKAQGGNDHLIQIPAVAPAILRWSTDSRYLTFVEMVDAGSGFVEDPNWKIYDVQTGTLSPSNGYPFLPTFTPQEAMVFTPVDQTPKLIFVLPNGRYLFYADKKRRVPQGETTQSIWKLMLGDRERQQLVETNIEMYAERDPASVTVLWSQDSESFTLTQSYTTGEQSGVPPILLVTNLGNNITNYRVHRDFAEPTVEGKTFITQSVFDLSANGKYALIVGSEKVENPTTQTPTTRFIVYDTQNNAQSHVLTTLNAATALDAHFFRSDPQRILLVSDPGLVLYHVATQQWEVVHPNVNPNGFLFARLSPNNDWLALEDKNRLLFVIETKYVDTTGVLKPTPVDNLRTQLDVCVTDQGIINSLNAKIEAQQWQSFINEVEAQRGKKIDISCADSLIALASEQLNSIATPSATP